MAVPTDGSAHGVASATTERVVEVRWAPNPAHNPTQPPHRDACTLHVSSGHVSEITLLLLRLAVLLLLRAVRLLAIPSSPHVAV